MLLFLLIPSLAFSQVAARRAFRLDELRTPPGFEVSVYATVPGVRHLAFGPNGVLYAAARGAGNIVAIPAPNRTVIALRGLNGPHSLQFRDSSLYVAVNDGVLLFPDAVTEPLTIASRSQRLLTVPSGGQHSTRTLGFSPDGLLYVSIGSTCNFCVEADERRAAILQFQSDGSAQQLFARGLRNAVSFAWHPATNEMWATDHGGDELGNTEPPEELNILTPGADYGWPDCIGNRRVHRWSNSLSKPERCPASAAPEWEMPAHSAPLGISFYTGDLFPASFQNDAFVALHGSWNRQDPAGYKVIRVRTQTGRATAQEDFLSGFLNPATRTTSGRPVHAITGPDGALYVSDDGNGNIYRISYNGPRINPNGVARVQDNIYSLYGRRLALDPANFRLSANGIPLETLYTSEEQINFVIPESLRGPITITLQNEIAADEIAFIVE